MINTCIIPSQTTLVKEGYKTENKFSENCIDWLLERTVQQILTWLQQWKTGCTFWTKISHLHSQIGVAIFAYFWQENPWRQNQAPSPFFVIVSLSMRR